MKLSQSPTKYIKHWHTYFLLLFYSQQYFQMEGVDLPERIMTPPDSPENSATGIIFDPDFIKSISDI